MTGQHPQEGDLGAYALGGLDDDETRAVDAHLADCLPCRGEVEQLTGTAHRLDDLPPEFFLEGEPAGVDLLVRRTVAQVRAERGEQDRVTGRRWLLPVAAAVVIGAALAGGGLLAGRQLAPQAAPSAVSSAPVAGTRHASATDPGTGAQLAVTVVPAAGWVKVSAQVKGVPAGQKCRLIVVGAGSDRQIAGSWIISAKAARDGSTVSGFALVDPASVSAVLVENFAGHQFVSVPIR